MEFIDDWKNNEVVFRKSACGVFLVGCSENEFVSILHDVTNGRVPGFEGEIAESNFSDETTLFVDDENAR